MASKIESGVYPVFNNVFTVKYTSGEKSYEVGIKDCESFSISNDSNIEEWTPMNEDGGRRALKTGYGLTISISAKRCVKDTGNDYIASTTFLTGQACTTTVKWYMPDGTLVYFDAVINVTSLGGDSTAVDVLEFDLESDGKLYTSTWTEIPEKIYDGTVEWVEPTETASAAE